MPEYEDPSSQNPPEDGTESCSPSICPIIRWGTIAVVSKPPMMAPTKPARRYDHNLGRLVFLVLLVLVLGPSVSWIA